MILRLRDTNRGRRANAASGMLDVVVAAAAEFVNKASIYPRRSFR
jgi:hypothetical protein